MRYHYYNAWLSRAVCGFTLCTLALLIVACEQADPDVVAGEAIVVENCKVCHASGINGAPILGNQKMWKPRTQQGLDTLVVHASNGFGLMPAKGGKNELTQDEIRQGVKYMLSLLEEP